MKPFFCSRRQLKKTTTTLAFFPARHSPLFFSAFPLKLLKIERYSQALSRRCAEKNTHLVLESATHSNPKKKAATAEHLAGDENEENDDGNVANLGNESNGGRRPFATPATASSAARFLNSALEGEDTELRGKKERERRERGEPPFLVVLF